jgi:hypothetical protein
MGAKGFISQRVEFPRFYVMFDLAIPCSCIKLSEPPPKLCEFLSRKTGDSFLKGFEFTHERKRYHLVLSRTNGSRLGNN